MYLIPNNNRWYNLMVSIPPGYRYSITILCMAALVGGWFWGIYRPVSTTIDYYKTCIKQAHAQYRQIDAAHSSCIKTEEAIGLLQKNLNNYKSGGQSAENRESYLKYLLNTAMAAGLTIENYTVSTLTDKKWYKKQHLHLYMQGTLNHYMSFFTHLKESKKMIFYKQITLEKTTDPIYTMHLEIGFLEVI